MMNEQRHAWLVMKYQFSTAVKYRIPIYRIRRDRAFRNFYRMKLAGRETEKVFQLHRPFRGKAAFKMSAFHPRFGFVKTHEDDADSDSVLDLKGGGPKPEETVSLEAMDQAIRGSAG